MKKIFTYIEPRVLFTSPVLVAIALLASLVAKNRSIVSSSAWFSIFALWYPALVFLLFIVHLIKERRHISVRSLHVLLGVCVMTISLSYIIIATLGFRINEDGLIYVFFMSIGTIIALLVFYIGFRIYLHIIFKKARTLGERVNESQDRSA
jgi:hypothetical protein